MKSKEHMQLDYLFYSRNREFCIVKIKFPCPESKGLYMGRHHHSNHLGTWRTCKES